MHWNAPRGPAAFLMALVLLTGGTGNSLAEEREPGTWTLEAALSRTLDGHPELAAAQAEADAWEARARQAARHENPEVELEVEEVGISRSWLFEDAEVTLSVRQAIPLSDRLQAGSHVALAGKEVVEAARHAGRAHIAAATIKEFGGAVAARERVALAREALAVTEAIRDAVVARIDAGDLPPAERVRGDVEVLRARMALEASEADFAVARARLAACWGGRPQEVLDVVGSLAPPESLPDTTPAGGPPLLRPHELAVAQAQASVRLEESRAVPDLELGLGFRESRGFDENGLVLSVAMPIPVWDRNRGAVDEAQAQVRKARHEADSRRRDWQAEVALRRVRLEADLARYRTLVDQVLPALQEAHRAIEEGFAAGRFGTLDLLESRHRLVEGRRDALDSLESCWRNHVELELLTGQGPEPAAEDAP